MKEIMKDKRTCFLLYCLCFLLMMSCNSIKIGTGQLMQYTNISNIVPSCQIITHTLRSREYEDKDEKYQISVRIEANDTIPSWCFSKIPMLTNVILSNQISIVEDNAFYACKNLRQINLENIIRCGESAFKMTSLDTVSLNKCKYVDDFAFSYCTKLNAVYFSSSIKKIGDFSFYADSSLVSIEIPNGEIGNSCFMGCGNLKEVALGKVTRIGEASFMGCSALVDVRLSKGIKIIEPMTFQDCTSLNSIVLPEGIEYIAENAFQGTGLTKVTIPSSVKKIESQAFANCNFLKTITICNTNTVVSYDAFDENVIIEYKKK